MRNLFLLFFLSSLTVSCSLSQKNDCTGEDCPCSNGQPPYPEFDCVEGPLLDNDRAYDWYLTQMGTGAAEDSNCGPTSVAMALRWFDPEQVVPVSEIRETITPGQTGWWYTNHIQQALSRWETPFSIQPADEENILAALERGSILLICITMGVITRADSPWETYFDRFYAYDSGHFLIVKGSIGNHQWLIVHDPNNWEGDYYDAEDTLPLGKNRYYNFDEVLYSMAIWWPYFFEIGISDKTPRKNIPIGRSGP